jgi:N-acetylneuraminic acid mutarotase
MGLTGEVLAAVYAYNVATNSWSLKAPLPTPLYETNGAALIQGKIYVSGGVGARKNARATLFRFDPVTNSWSARATMPTDTEGGVTAVINNELYVLTGCQEGFECDQGVIPLAFYRYSPAADKWTPLPNPPLTVRPRKAAVIQGKLYTFGGDNRRQIRVYDPATNRWTSRPPIPLEHAPQAQSQRPVVLGGKVYLVGGIEILPDDTYRPLRTSVYDPSTGAWEFKAAMPVGQTSLSADRVVVGGQSRIQVLTSEINSSALHRNWQYIP